MSELKKTLQHGTPAIAAHRMITPAGAQPGQAAPPPTSGVPSGVVPSSNPASPRGMMPSSSGDGPPSSLPMIVPPPATKDELHQTRPPPGRRTPSATRAAPDFGPPLPENCPGWMLRARRMSLALEEAIRAGQPNPSLEACIERAWAAWELDGAGDKQIVRVARLVEKAHTAIRDTPAPQLERAYNECAQVLWAGLPRHVKSKQEFAQIMLVVRDLRAEADPWAAVVDATSKILGWSFAGRAHAAQTIRVAILSERTG